MGITCNYGDEDQNELMSLIDRYRLNDDSDDQTEITDSTVPSRLTPEQVKIFRTAGDELPF